MSSRLIARRRGFTLLEIMIVVSIVVILSWLAMVVVGRIRDRAVAAIIENNLRQLYQAKEYYYSETGDSRPVLFLTLVKQGYLSESLAQRIFVKGGTMETRMGWKYLTQFVAGEPAYAYNGANGPDRDPSVPALYYPGPPAAGRQASPNAPAGTGASGPGSTSLPGALPGGGPGPSSGNGGTTPSTNPGSSGPGSGNPPGGGTTSGTTAGGTAGGNSGAGGGGTQGSAGGGSSPGNSAFGHSQGNSGNSQNQSPGKAKGHD